MSDVVSVVFTGRGGQGVKLASELLAWSASADGFNPVQYSVYGALIRGGEIACSLAASRTDPGVPLRSEYDLMCALHNDWFERYYPLLVPGAVLVADAVNLDPALFTRDDVTHLVAPFGELAREVGDLRAINMVAVGVTAKLSGLASPTALEAGMMAVVPPHRAERIKRNLEAVTAGYVWVP